MAIPDLDAIRRTLTGLLPSPVTLKAAAMPHSGRVIIEPAIAPTLADADRWVSIALVSAEAAMIEAGYTATYLGKGAFAVLIVAGTPDSEAVEEAALDLDAIEARAEAATAEPWTIDQPVSSQPERPNIESIHRPTPPPAAVPLPRGIDTDAYAKALKTLVKRFEATGPVGSAALILMATWEAVEGEPVSMSRVATFVDMAAMVVEDACPHEAWEIDGRGTRTRCVDCRTWLGPIGGE